MPRAFVLKVNRTLDYIRADGKRVPAQVTGGIVGQTCNLRLADGSTRTGIAESTDRTTFPKPSNVWRRP